VAEVFVNLFNGGNDTMDTKLDDSFDDLNRCFVCRIQELEVKEALKRMKGGKAMGLDGICWSLVLKCYESRTRQHKMLIIKDIRPSKHYLPQDIMIFRRRL
jgi:hypothetical protein